MLSAEIDPIYFEKTYFLEPTDIGVKPFSLLRRALEETERIALHASRFGRASASPRCARTKKR